MCIYSQPDYAVWIFLAKNVLWPPGNDYAVKCFQILKKRKKTNKQL